MAVYLIGGGRDAARTAALLAPFVADAAEAARRRDAAVPRIAVLLVLEDDDTESVMRFSDALTAAGSCAPVVVAIVEGGTFEVDCLDGVDGIFVGGGLTPAYLDAVMPLRDRVAAAVATGIPYAGFSAGAAIAAADALIGGYVLDGVEVASEDVGEELVEVTVRAGLALVPFAVDVHAAQWGTLSRLVAAAESGHVGSGFAIDEATMLVVTEMCEVRGDGRAWRVTGEDDGVRVLSLRFGDSPWPVAGDSGRDRNGHPLPG